MRPIPNALIADLAGVISDHHTHAQIDMIFMRAGAPGEVPSGSKIVKVREWLNAVNADSSLHPYAVLGGILEELMDRDLPAYEPLRGAWTANRERVHRALQKHGLTYTFGGNILGATLSAPSRSLDDLIRPRNLR